MEVYLNKITGISDAMISMLMSKKSWTQEKAEDIKNAVYYNVDLDGRYTGVSESLKDYDEAYISNMEKLIHYGVEEGHTTLLRFIDLSFTVIGLHRAAQDDFDSHAKRLDNRIIRASTRLSDFSDGEKSDWYKGKIMFPTELENLILPDRIYVPNEGAWFVLTDYGYIREDLKDDRDVKRGLYPEAIPSNFIFKVQYPELCHIVQMRDKNSHAHPELQIMIEQIKDIVTRAQPWLGKNLNNLVMDPGPVKDKER